jgi:ATPase subunit of ABC transporter with duplicated ATPase domains
VGELACKVPIVQLSGGQKARVAFAKLAVAPADILFLDEVRPRRICKSRGSCEV